MSIPAILPTTVSRSQAFGPPYRGSWRSMTFLTAASGVWTPKRGGNALVVVTGPGGPGVAGRAGSAGGTAIAILDLAGLFEIPYTVGRGNPLGDTTFLTLTGFRGSNTTPGGATGGVLNLKGGRGRDVALGLGGSVSIPARDLFTPGDELAGQAGTFGLNGTATETPGGASIWGGGDTIGGTSSTTYGSGGPANASTWGYGAPGVIGIMEF